MNQLTQQQLIESSVLFRNLLPHEAQAIIERLQTQTVSQDTQIIKYGEWHGQFYIVAAGSVRVLLQEPEGARTKFTMAHLGPGECFGEMSLITGEPATATVSAEEEATLLSLSQRDFLTLIGDCPTLSRNINHILSLRLARMNQHILSTRNAERVWLALIDQPGELMERTLPPHIAYALAERSRKRVLLLELCDYAEATGPRFALHEDQLRPDLLSCIQNHNLLEQHKSAIPMKDGRFLPALATLTHYEHDQQRNGWHERIAEALIDLAGCYDYLLLVTTQTTPEALLRAVSEYAQRAVVLISAHNGNVHRGKLTSSPAYAFLAKHSGLPRSLFLAHTPERPTIGVQDRYNALLGLGNAKTLPMGQGLKRILPGNASMLQRCWQQGRPLNEIAPEAELTQGVDFVARHIARQTVGIAFGGGAARGFAHVGALKRLLEAHVPIDYMSACSIGVITPGMYGMGRSIAEIEKVFLNVQHHLVKYTVPYTSIFSGRGLKHMFRSVCGGWRFEDLTIPLAAVTVDLGTRMGVAIDRGLLWKAGLASVSLPGIFPPVTIGKHVLMDAGMHDPVPVSAIRDMGADILVAIDLSGPPLAVNASARAWFPSSHTDHPRSWFHAPHIGDVLLRSYDIAMETVSMYSVREAHVIIRPNLHSVSLRQFSGGHKFVEEGYAAVAAAMPTLQARLPWLQ